MNRTFALGLAVMVAVGLSGCSEQKPALEIAPGTDVAVTRTDGVTIEGRLVEVQPGQVVIASALGMRTVPRTDIASLSARSFGPAAAARPRPGDGERTGTSAPPSAESRGRAGTDERPADPPKTAPVRQFREVTIPAGTVLPVELRTAVSSDRSQVEDPVRATLRAPVSASGVQVLPAGTAVLGHVTAAEGSGRVKGRAHLAVRFTALDLPEGRQRLPITSEPVSHLAPATKKKDAATIGGGAAGGALIGGILGGGDGAARGAAIGGAAGTGLVLSTRGDEVRLGPGTYVGVRLTSPLTVQVTRGERRPPGARD